MCAIFQMSADDIRDIRDICDDISTKYGEDAVGQCVGRDIYPNGTAAVVGGEHKVALMRWGFPLPGTKKVVFNARSETLAEKPMFRTALQNRCLVPATMYYEFGADHKKYRILLPKLRFFYLAGLWMRDRTVDGGFRFTVITTVPNTEIAHVHNRMPVILEPEQAQLWMDGFNENLLMPSKQPTVITGA